LAYPAITSAFDSSGERTPYDPFFTSAYKENLTAPTFSLALMRGQSGGYIAFGGLPPVQGVNGSFANTKIEILSGASDLGNELAFYTITPDAIAYSGSQKSNNDQYIVDSGTTLNYMPSTVAKAINAAYSPKATLDSQNQVYTVDCKATPPKFGVTIGG
jgi:aspergillopepsin I